MKYIHTIGAAALLAVLLLSVLTFTSCSADIEEDEGTEKDTLITGVAEEKTEAGMETTGTALPESEPEAKPEPDPEPDWADSTVTITVGRFKTKQQLLNKLTESFHIAKWIIDSIMHDRMTVTPPDQQYTVDIAVVTLIEAGIHDAWEKNEEGIPINPTGITKVTNRFRELGYRPLTPEEAMELRLHLPDQPETGTKHKMSSFFVLATEEAGLLLNSDTRFTYLMAHISFREGERGIKRAIGERTVKAMGAWFLESGPPENRFEFLIDPNDRDPIDLEWLARHAIRMFVPGLEPDLEEPAHERPTTRFAAAVINSEKRQ